MGVFSYTDSSVTAGSKYDYSVTCSNTAFGESRHSSALTNILAVNLPTSNKKPTLIKATKTSLFVQWSSSDNGGDSSSSLLYSLEMRDVSSSGSSSVFRQLYQGTSLQFNANSLKTGNSY